MIPRIIFCLYFDQDHTVSYCSFYHVYRYSCTVLLLSLSIEIDFNFVWITGIEISSDKKTDLISFLFYIPYIFLTFGVLIFFSVNVYYIIMYMKILICVWNRRFISLNYHNVEAARLKYDLKPVSHWQYRFIPWD